MNAHTLLRSAIDALPVGVILVDAGDRVTMWNAPAEEFIAAVGRPTLFEGMSLEETHPGPYGPGMRAVVDRLKAGGTVPGKTIRGSGRSFRVLYRGLHTDKGEYLGIAQVIEPLEADPQSLAPGIFEAAARRRSIRAFTPEPLTSEQIGSIIEAGRRAPSAVNLQPARVLAVTSGRDLEVVRAAAYGIGACAEAPCVFVCMADLSADEQLPDRITELEACGAIGGAASEPLLSGTGRPFTLKIGRDIALMNCAIAVAHMDLQAAAMGLGSCWVHHAEFDEIRTHFALPGHLEIITLLAVGHPSESPDPRPRIPTIEWSLKPEE